MTDPKILHTRKVNQADAKKKKIQMIVLGILLAFFAYIVIATFFGGKAKKGPPRPAKKISATSAGVSQTTPLRPVQKPEEENHWGSSPFSLKTAEDRGDKVLRLEGVVHSPGGESYAVINEKIVKRGDRVADNTVKDIRDRTVVLESDKGERVELKS